MRVVAALAQGMIEERYQRLESLLIWGISRIARWVLAEEHGETQGRGPGEDHPTTLCWRASSTARYVEGPRGPVPGRLLGAVP